MSLVPISGVLATVAKAEQVDPESTALLCEMTLFDVLTDLCDQARPIFEADLDAFVTKRVTDTRRALVRQFIERRLDDVDVTEVVKAASYATVLEVTKGKDDPTTPWWDARDMSGRFTSAADRGTAALRTNNRQGYVDPIRAERYAALRDTGAALSSIGGPTGTALGAMATAAGGLGPEAERVLGRGLKRTAYRYRGTERTADRRVAADTREIRDWADGIIEGKKEGKNVRQTLDNLASVSEVNRRGNRQSAPPLLNIARFNLGQGYTPDQYRLAVQGDVAVDYLRKKLPTPRQTAISMAAGRTPPSVGLLIDRDGDVVSEAQGFNGDHFLPFDLKNLKRMQGGQYVRTRAMGGPTVEDVYTGLLTGARQMQVVSNSGVFTLEFDPSIRGGRRYSDKATQMIRRYEALLGTIGSGYLMQNDIDPERKRQLRRDALAEAPGNAARAREIYTELLEQERNKQSFEFQEDDELEAQALAEAREELGPGAGRAQIADLAQEKHAFLRREQKQQRVKAFQLDADGYAAAMRSLAEEFPFYIRSVRVETIPEFVRSRGLVDPESADVPVHNPAADRGYIERGETNINVQGVPDKDAQGKPTYFARAGLGRGIPTSDPRSGVGRQAQPSEGGEVTSTEGATAAKPGAVSARPSQQPDTTGWRVPFERVRDTRTLAERADLTKTSNQDAVNVGLERVRGFLSSVGGSAGNSAIANGEATQAVALGAGSAVDFALWLQHKGGARELAQMSDAERAKAATLLARLPKDARTVQSDVVVTDDDIKSLSSDIKPMLDVMEQAAPFGEPFDPAKIESYSTRDAKPMAFPEIVAAGDKIENYDRLAAVANRKGLGTFLDKPNLPQTINTLRDELAEAVAGRPVAGRTPQQSKPEIIRRELEAAHFAWSYQHARKIAESLAPSTPATSAPAQAGSLPFEGVGFRKGEVRYSAQELMEMFRAGPLESAVSKALMDRSGD